MNSTNNTLERIQNEIRENIQREKELKNGYLSLNEVNSQCTEIPQALTKGISKLKLEHERETRNGCSSLSEINPVRQEVVTSVPNGISKQNGFTRRFIPSTNTRGVMQKFFKARGKLCPSMNSVSQQNGFSPVRIRVEKGQTLRNGYVPAEEKIVKELLDFQIRETELRNERMKSQPDLMAALELEESQLNGKRQTLKSAKSMTNLYQAEDPSKINNSVPS